MAKHKLPQPTEGELAILRVLWRRGPSTVREVHTALSAEQTTGYTTTLKLMQIMAEKGLVARDESRQSHVYSAALREEQAQRQYVKRLIQGVFGGSAPRLVMQALAAKKASPEELAEIRKLLDKMEGIK